jgi:hypothetical protein
VLFPLLNIRPEYTFRIIVDVGSANRFEFFHRLRQHCAWLFFVAHRRIMTLCGAFGISPVLRVQDSTQATQDPGALDPCAQKIMQKPDTPFEEKLTS